MKFLVMIVSVAIEILAFAEKQPIDRYQSIIDRQMFGPLPPGFDPAKMPSEVSKSSSSKEEKQLTQEQEQLKSSIHFSVINVTPEGDTAIGFTDNSDPKVPVHYYLKVGEKRNGWEVKEADPKEASMTIVKNDIEVSLKLGDNSGSGGGKTSKTAVATATNSTKDRRSSLFGANSLRGRRRMREQLNQAEREKREAELAEREKEREQREAAEKEQRDAERAEQRQQLLAIQEELRRQREEKAKQETEKHEDGNDNSQ